MSKHICDLCGRAVSSKLLRGKCKSCDSVVCVKCGKLCSSCKRVFCFGCFSSGSNCPNCVKSKLDYEKAVEVGKHRDKYILLGDMMVVLSMILGFVLFFIGYFDKPYSAYLWVMVILGMIIGGIISTNWKYYKWYVPRQ